jgi:hypothetical protein
MASSTLKPYRKLHVADRDLDRVQQNVKDALDSITGNANLQQVAASGVPTSGGGIEGIELENGGTPLAGGPFTTLDVDSTLTATNAGGGVAGLSVNFPTIPVGWQTAVDIDFTAQANQTLATDTTYTIGGQTWTKINSANDRVAMAVVSGTGLVVKPAANAGDYFGSTRNLPAITLNLSAVIPGFHWAMPVRVWLFQSADNMGSNNDQATLAIETGTSLNYVLKRGYQSAALTWTTTANLGGSNVGQAILSHNTTDRVFLLTLSDGIGGHRFLTRTGVYSAGWPTIASLNPSSYYAFDQSAAAGDGKIANYANVAASAWDVLVGAGSVNDGGGTLSVTFARILVEYLAQ